MPSRWSSDVRLEGSENRMEIRESREYREEKLEGSERRRGSRESREN